MDGLSWVLPRGFLFAWRAAPDTGRAGVGSIQKISWSCLRSVWRACSLDGRKMTFHTTLSSSSLSAQHSVFQQELLKMPESNPARVKVSRAVQGAVVL